jgi:hypothetical protein
MFFFSLLKESPMTTNKGLKRKNGTAVGTPSKGKGGVGAGKKSKLR